MALFDWFNHIDTQMFLALNGHISPFFDSFFVLFSQKQVWYPLYLFIALLILQRYKIKGIWIILFIALAIVISDQLSGLTKELAGRLRPSHQGALADQIYIPSGKGGQFGFFSSHAANSFTLAFFMGYITRRKRVWATFTLWALITSYSRIYLGVHFPFDVLVGALFGIFTGWSVYKLLMIFDFHLQRKRISLEGAWKMKFTRQLLVAMVFTVTTLLLVAYVAPNIF